MENRTNKNETNKNETNKNETNKMLNINGEMFISMDYLADKLVRYFVPACIETWASPTDDNGVDKAFEYIVTFVNDDEGTYGGLGMPERGRDLMSRYINARYGAWLRENLKKDK